MDNKNFNAVLTSRLNKIKNTLSGKAEEYARGDRLSNFRQIANLSGITPEKALGDLVAKHIVALYDFINDIDAGVVQCYGRWDEKIGDICCYMVLLDAMVSERIATEATQPHSTPTEPSKQENQPNVSKSILTPPQRTEESLNVIEFAKSEFIHGSQAKGMEKLEVVTKALKEVNYNPYKDN